MDRGNHISLAIKSEDLVTPPRHEPQPKCQSCAGACPALWSRGFWASVLLTSLRVPWSSGSPLSPALSSLLRPPPSPAPACDKRQQREILRPLPALCSEPSLPSLWWYSPPPTGEPRMELQGPDLPSLPKLPTQPDKLVNNRTLVKEGRWSLRDGKWMVEPRGGPTHCLRGLWAAEHTRGLPG